MADSQVEEEAKLRDFDLRLQEANLKLAEINELVAALSANTNSTKEELQIFKNSTSNELKELSINLDFMNENSHSSHFSLKR
jgi:hypothetical protein